ncbi:SUMF1/EgtB/PvdO family nonheme iron enzyme [Prosthecodimorpha staleyi]|uniref:SUMF1/EgtB/PvdO family nonheme iron enzyme n=1 Tax=Prosthecodimorpha staleyi TaxID=2840188 RepID=A0A947D6F2_9HYPH|nr:SUMF1/EgtB/PvdO family nonheme iron enzyme [Prosthecodimorpha staleyi]MBT9291928.1 SUMF1/EgtB/PvdO family nonheme iron enzyme [Prosthecodimorpha staleyi]
MREGVSIFIIGLMVETVVMRFCRLLGYGLLGLLLAITTCAPALAEKQVALVIGNDRYVSVTPLRKAVNDARAVAAVLKEIGFEVISGENLSRRELNRKLGEFDQAIGPGDTVLFYFAGHGVALEGSNYLLSTDMEQLQPGGENTVKDEGYSVSGLIERIARRGAGNQIVVLDACRDNPFASSGRRSVGLDRGLGRVDTPSGTFVLMAAGAGQSALDRLSDRDPDPNSVFTRQLIPLLRTPGLTHIEIAKRLQTGVRTLASTVGHSQQPAYYDEVPGTIVINRAVGSPPTPAVADPDAAMRSDFAIAQQANSRAVWQAFIDRYKSGFLIEAARERLAALSAPPPAVTTTPVVTAPGKIEVAGLPPSTRPDGGSCDGGAQTVSLGSRSAGVLTSSEERCLKAKDEFRECADCPAMVVVPAGSFTMGSPESEKKRESNEGPQRTVRIGKPFAVGKFTVSFAEWDACVAGGGCKGYRPLVIRGWDRGILPVVNVSWEDAQAFVTWLSKVTGKSYRLLTEAEWEYAARAGTTTAFWWGPTISTNQANYDGNYTYASNQKGLYRMYTLPVDSFSANPFGLYQMLGNVNQWVEDCSSQNYKDAPTDGSANVIKGCDTRILRGGSYSELPWRLRAAQRFWTYPFNRDLRYGFRVARTLNP